MKDRLPLYPGRVKLTPVAGQENTYDMVRADSPQQEGTPLNKTTLLTDETAAAIGLTQADPTVDNALARIMAEVAAGAKIATGSYVGTGTYGANNPCSLTFDFVPQVIFIYGAESYTSSGPGPTAYAILTSNASNYMHLSQSSKVASSLSYDVSFSGNTVSWSGNTMGIQMNIKNDNGTIQYHYIAIG